MKENDLYLNILIGIVSGLVVLLGSFVSEDIQNKGLRIGVTIAMTFILFMVFVKTFQKLSKKKTK